MNRLFADIGLALWRLLPANPIVVRVVTGGSKRPGHLLARVAYLVILLVVMLLASALTPGTGTSLSERAKSATQVFKYVSILQLVMISLLAPVFTAGAISQEKDADTFNVLLTTPLSNAQIVLGSLCSRLFFIISLLLAGLPIFCIIMLFGGVTTDEVFLSFGIAACTAIITGALAITISVLRVGTRGTIFSFYMGVGLFLLAGLALGIWPRTYVPESVLPGGGEGMSFLAPFHPFLALAAALKIIVPPEFSAVEHYGWPTSWMLAWPHAAYMLVTLLASALLVGLSAIFVRRVARQPDWSWWAALRRRTSGGERARKPRRVWANPVAWREAVTRGTAASSGFARYSYLATSLVAGLVLILQYKGGAFSTIQEARAWLSAIVLIEFVIVMLMATNTAATAITRERESGTMELLLSTPLTSRYIIWGKLRGLVSFTIPLLAVPAATVLVAALLDVRRAQPIAYVDSALLLAPLLLVYSGFACMLGLHMSLKNTRSVQAVLQSVAILVVVGFGLGMCGYAGLSSAGVAIPAISPLTFVTGVWAVLNPDELCRYSSPSTVTDMRFILAVGTVIALVAYGAFAASTYRSMVSNFDMIVRKQSR